MKRLILMTVLLLAPMLGWADPPGDHDRRSGHPRSEHPLFQWQQPGIEFRGTWFRLPGWAFRESPGFHSRKGSHDSYRRPAAVWKQASRISTGHRLAGRQVIRINREVAGIGLAGLKREARIYDVRVEFGNGRVMPLEQLEGYIADGDFVSTRFRHPRYVEKLILEVGPHRHRPARIGVEYLEVARHRGGHHR